MSKKLDIKKKYKAFIEEALKADVESFWSDSEKPIKEIASNYIEHCVSVSWHYPIKAIVDNIQGWWLSSISCFYNKILSQAEDFWLITSMMNNKRFSKAKNKVLALENVENQILDNYFTTLATYITQIAR